MKAASKILGPVWIGSDPARYAASLGPFNVLVACAEELPYGPGDFPGLRVVSAPLDDDPQASRDALRLTLVTAQSAASTALRLARGPILCTCHMGLNRSALVAAYILHRLYPQLPGPQIVKIIREKRHARALSNPLFELAVKQIARLRK